MSKPYLINKFSYYCGNCRKPLYDHGSSTHKKYMSGKYKYCPKCGDKVE